MVTARYAGVGTQCPQFQVTVETGGQLSTTTRYFSFQLQNRCGFNLPAVSGAINIPINSKLKITIPESARKPAWDIHYFVISSGTTSDASTHIQIALVPGYQFGIGISPQSVLQNLPYTLYLSCDEHIALAPSVANIVNLPTGNNRIDGQTRFVTAINSWLEYRADSTLPVSAEVYPVDIGQWVRVGGASTYISDTTSSVGSDRDLTTINPATVIPTPPYPAINRVVPDWEAKYWIYNDDSYSVQAGTEFGIEIEFNNKRSPDLLSGLFMVRLIGFAQSDGTYRTTDSDGRDFPSVGAYFTWNPRAETPFATVDDLQPGEAIAIGVKPFFSVQELNNQVPPKSVVGVVPVIRTQSGDYNPLGKLIPEGVVYAEADKYRVLSGVGLSIYILSGMAIVGSYDFPLKPARTINGLRTNEAGQKVVINGNGAVFLQRSDYQLSPSEGLRALVGTVGGVSGVAPWSDAVSITAGLQVTLNYPCDAQGNGTIRTEYPDVIAGNNKTRFNAPRVKIYLQRQDTGEIRCYSGYAVLVGASQAFQLSNWNDGTVVTELPVNSENFSLFNPVGASIAATTIGTFPVTSYKVTFAFEYDGNQVTSVSHASPPCIQEFSGNFAAIFDKNVYIENQEDSFINALIFG